MADEISDVLDVGGSDDFGSDDRRGELAVVWKGSELGNHPRTMKAGKPILEDWVNNMRVSPGGALTGSRDSGRTDPSQRRHPVDRHPAVQPVWVQTLFPALQPLIPHTFVGTIEVNVFKGGISNITITQSHIKENAT